MVALGQVKGQPAATNMKEMVWDEELAVIAQRWADQVLVMNGNDLFPIQFFPSSACPDTTTGGMLVSENWAKL